VPIESYCVVHQNPIPFSPHHIVSCIPNDDRIIDKVGCTGSRRPYHGMACYRCAHMRGYDHRSIEGRDRYKRQFLAQVHLLVSFLSSSLPLPSSLPPLHSQEDILTSLHD